MNPHLYPAMMAPIATYGEAIVPRAPGQNPALQPKIIFAYGLPGRSMIRLF